MASPKPDLSSSNSSTDGSNAVLAIINAPTKTKWHIHSNEVTDTKDSEHKSATVVGDTLLQCHQNKGVLKGTPNKKNAEIKMIVDYYEKGYILILTFNASVHTEYPYTFITYSQYMDMDNKPIKQHAANSQWCRIMQKCNHAICI